MTVDADIRFEQLTENNWPQFETLFGEKGGCGGCWCMLQRQLRSDFEANKGVRNKAALFRMVKQGLFVGILAFLKEEAIGWISFAPREQFVRLEKSRSYKAIDDKEVWSITCFFIRKDFRHKGISSALIEATKDFAREHEIPVIEAYPVIPHNEKMPDVFAWTGFYSTFEKAGFQKVGKGSESKPMMRFEVTPS